MKTLKSKSNPVSNLLNANPYLTRSKKIGKNQLKFLSTIEHKKSKKISHKFLEETYNNFIKNVNKKRSKSKINNKSSLDDESLNKNKIKKKIIKKNLDKSEDNSEYEEEKNNSDINSDKKKLNNSEENSDEENTENENNDKFNIYIAKNDEINKLLLEYKKDKKIKNNKNKKGKEKKEKENKNNKNKGEEPENKYKTFNDMIIEEDIDNNKNNEKNNIIIRKNKEIKRLLDEYEKNKKNKDDEDNKDIEDKNLKNKINKNKKKINKEENKENDNKENIGDNEITNNNNINNKNDDKIKDKIRNSKEAKPLEKKILLQPKKDDTPPSPKKNIFSIFRNTIQISASKAINKIKPELKFKIIKEIKVNSIQIDAVKKPKENITNLELDFRFNFEKKEHKTNFFVEIEEITPKKLLGNKTYRSNSDHQVNIIKKRGRKKKKLLNENNINKNNNLGNYDIEVSIGSEKQKQKSENKFSIEFDYASSQHTSKDQGKNNLSISNINSINENNNVINLGKNTNKFRKKNKNKNKIDSSFIRIAEEDDDDNDDIDFKIINNNEENVEIFSLESTPEAKKKLRNNNINLNQDIYDLEEKKIKKRKKRKKLEKKSKEKTEEFIEIDVSHNKKKKKHKGKDSKNSSNSKSSGEFFSDIKLIHDENYFLFDTQYIKYNPIDRVVEEKKNFKNRDGEDYKDWGYDKEYIKIPAIYKIPRINPELSELFPEISEKLKKIGMVIYEKEEREEDFYKGSFPLVDEKKHVEVMVPCYDDEQVFAERKERFPKLQKFDEDNDIMTDNDQLDMEIKRGNECLSKFLEDMKKKKKLFG